MNGELAQLAALVSHARAVIAGREKDELTLANSTFQFVHSLRFERARRLLGIELATFVASSPSGWYDHLRRAGVDSIELVVWSGEGEFAAHVLSALSGGGNWGIRTSGAGSPSLWTARWSPDRRDDPQRRIWAVAYR